MNDKFEDFTQFAGLVNIYKTTSDEKKKRIAHLKIVELSMILVKKIAGSVNLRTDLTKEDLMQIGVMGLIKAIELYKPKKKAKFSTYATYFIRGEILHYLRDKGSIIKTPREMQEILIKINSAIKKLKNKGYDDPTNEQIAAETNIELSKICEALQTEFNKSPVSLDQSIFKVDNYDEDTGALIDKLPSGDYQEDLDFYENKITLTRAIEQLPERLKNIIKMHYYKDMSQRDIANCLNLSQMQISRLLKRGLNQLYDILSNSETRRTTKETIERKSI